VSYAHSPSCCYGANGDLRWAVPVYTTVVGALAGGAGGGAVYLGRRLVGR
jgi:hypothetical protein